jgi:hypothetical protein
MKLALLAPKYFVLLGKIDQAVPPGTLKLCSLRSIVPALVCNQFIVAEKLALHLQPKVLRAST